MEYSSGLPATAREAGTRVRGRARTRARAARAVLADRERVARLRASDDGVAVRVRRSHRHLTRTGADGQTGVARVGAGRVVLRVGVTRLNLRDHVSCVRLGRGVLALRALAQECGQSDRGQDADDQNDYEELDKGETLLLIVNALTDLPQHFWGLLVGLVVRATSIAPRKSDHRYEARVRQLPDRPI